MESGVECGEWSLECGVWSLECGVWSVECVVSVGWVWRVESGVWWSVQLECGAVWAVWGECGVWGVWGSVVVWGGECGVYFGGFQNQILKPSKSFLWPLIEKATSVTFLAKSRGLPFWRLPKPDFEALKVLYVGPLLKSFKCVILCQIKGGALLEASKTRF